MEKLFTDIALWNLLQVNHKQVIRWGSFLKEDSALCAQNNLQHVTSLVHVATWICFVLERDLDFNKGLILSAVNLHEHGEAILQRDIVYSEKNLDSKGDALEYHKVCEVLHESFSDDEDLCIQMEKAFLLQFVTQENKWENFPRRAMGLLFELKEESFLEAQIFNAIERYEYFYYCLEKNSLPNKNLLLNVVKNQAHHLDKYASKDGILGFEKIWTQKHSLAAEELKFEEMINLIKTKDLDDLALREKLEDINPDHVSSEFKKELLDLLKLERPILFKNWTLEVANGYM